MMRTCTAFILLSFLFCFSIASPQDKYIPTPGGSRSQSCTHFVPDGYIVEDLKSHSLIRNVETGEVLKTVKKCPYPTKRISIKSPELPYGWAAYAYSLSLGEITGYDGKWTVPGNPVDSTDSQVLFLFTGLQNNYDLEADVTNIIQPVLQWGVSAAGGGNYWALASWYVDSMDNAYFSSLVQTTAENLITGTMDKKDSTPSSVWTIESLDTTSNLSTTLNIATNTSEPDAFVTLEVYNVDSCQDYPTGTDLFYDLAFTPSTITPSWQVQHTRGCQESVTVSDTGVTIKF